MLGIDRYCLTDNQVTGFLQHHTNECNYGVSKQRVSSLAQMKFLNLLQGPGGNWNGGDR